MSVITEEERSLLNKAKSFDESALGEIYDRHHEALYRYAMRLLGDQQIAEDCIAETFLRFINSLSKGHVPQVNLRAYLYRIAHNWITDHYRRKKHDEERELDENFSTNKDLLTEVEKDIQIKQIRCAILSLTYEQQLVILLKYFEGFQNDEIADLLGKRVGAIKALLNRSVVTLRKKIKN